MDQLPSNHQITLAELKQKLGEITRYLKIKYKMLVIALILGGLLGGGYAHFRKVSYVAELSFVLAEAGSGNLSSYSGIASQFGIDLGGAGESNGLFKGDNILEFIKSRRIITSVLLTETTIKGKPELLANRYANAIGMKAQWHKEKETKNFTFLPAKQASYLQDSLIQVLYKTLLKKTLVVAKPDKKLNIIKVTTQSTDALFAKAFTEKLINDVMSFYVDTKTQKEQENLNILNRQVDSVRRKLYDALGGVAEVNDYTPNPNRARQKVQILSQHHKVDAQIDGKILEELVKNQELARISLRKQMPIIQVVDTPLMPLENNAISPLKGMVIGAFLFCFLVTSVLIMRVLMKG